MAQPPAPHRYVNNVPVRMVLAARRVIQVYRGDARRIWNDHPTARELQQRFDAFVGVGQKKAAMAVLILQRDLRVPIRDMAGSNIAYDIPCPQGLSAQMGRIRSAPRRQISSSERTNSWRASSPGTTLSIGVAPLAGVIAPAAPISVRPDGTLGPSPGPASTTSVIPPGTLNCR